jgi:hypothetical protein
MTNKALSFSDSAQNRCEFGGTQNDIILCHFVSFGISKKLNSRFEDISKIYTETYIYTHDNNQQ